MKLIEAFGKGSGKWVNAYEAKDIDAIRPHLVKAHEIWVWRWIKQGQTDEGSSTGGKGLQIWYRGPRKRSADLKTAVQAPPVQGNLSAARSYEPALKYLKDQGIESEYYDGWMN
tara:strand:- start:19 stop:360 length:342 start_codon:yes stop_codon:yes gene_type:complete